MSTILIAGGTGLLGQRLSFLLKEKGHDVLHLSRRPNAAAAFPAYAWDPEKGTLDEAALRRADFIINLAGEGIADGRWTATRKRRIIDSRVKGALLFRSFLEKTPDHRVKACLSASAIGYYGNRGDEMLTENDLPGSTGFLAESTRAWEKATGQVAATGVRTVAFRIGIVLSTRGGALPKMLLPFRFFMASWFGNGRQWYSWIHIDDLCRMFIHAIENEQLNGFYNGASPQPARNKDLILSLKKALRKPAFSLPVPAFALRLILGEMADAVLTSTRVSSAKISETGFQFHFPELLPAFDDLLRKNI